MLSEAVDVPSPQKILHYAIGSWLCGIVASAVGLRLFELLEAAPSDAETIAERTGMSPRAVQALLDGLLGLGLATLQDGRYHNTPDASFYLVPGRAEYLGSFVELTATSMPLWTRLPEVALSGKPVLDDFEPRDNPEWEPVVRGITPIAFSSARAAAERLNIEEADAFHMLDLGGGSGVFAAHWLTLNQRGRATQVDWSNVNALAREYVAGFGVADRFETIDGDLLAVDLTDDAYDFVILSWVAHFFSPDVNRRLFARIRRALKTGGVLVIADLVVDDDRNGDAWALTFGANMLLSTDHGAVYRKADFGAWLDGAGFADWGVEPVESMPHTLVYAR